MGENDDMFQYEADFYGWAFERAARLHAGEPVDIEHIAEELETLGRSQQEQLTNHLAVLIQHLLKCEHQAKKRKQRTNGV